MENKNLTRQALFTKMLKLFTVISILIFFTTAVQAKCSMRTPEITLKCFDDDTKNYDLSSLEDIYLNTLHISMLTNYENTSGGKYHIEGLKQKYPYCLLYEAGLFFTITFFHCR